MAGRAVTLNDVPLGQAYQNRLTAPFVGTLPSLLPPSEPLSGEGIPEGQVPGVQGQTYCQLDSGDLWIKMQGDQKLGWRLIGKCQGQVVPCADDLVLVLDGAQAGVPYTYDIKAQMEAQNVPLLAFDILSGVLPSGLALNHSTGIVNGGSPTTPGTYDFELVVQ